MARAVISSGLAVVFLAVAGPVWAGPDLADVVSDRGLEGFVTADRLPMPEASFLRDGRLVWEDTCMGCHGGNKATGAPKITAQRAWEPRIAQGLPLLIQHATEGFVGPKYTEMPARGGNSDLSDQDIARAVAFMVWASGGAEAATAFIATQDIEKD